MSLTMDAAPVACSLLHDISRGHKFTATHSQTKPGLANVRCERRREALTPNRLWSGHLESRRQPIPWRWWLAKASTKTRVGAQPDLVPGPKPQGQADCWICQAGIR